MQLRVLHLIPGLAVAAGVVGIVVAPAASADCNSTGGSTLCSSGGSVRGSSGAPTSLPTFDPYPCVGTPGCDYYDSYDPGVIFDPPNWGGGGGFGGNRPQPR